MKKYYKGKDYTSYFVIYTLVFTAMIILLFYRFWQERISFVWKADGWAQHIRALQFYSDWLQQIARNVFFKHKLDIPLWSFSIGYGSDIITTLHYYVIGDPLCLLSIFVPNKYMVHFYDIMILFRMYLAGLSFSAYCFYKKQNTKIAVLAGAILYVFSTYILLLGFHHPFFINPFIYFPLLLIGIEKILENKSAALFICIVFICTVSNFYFMYMIALNAVLYLLIRMLHVYGIKNIKILFRKLGCMIIYAITGVLMGAVILVPILNLFVENSRDGAGQPFRLFYEKEFYQNIPGMLVAFNSREHHTMLALCGVSLFCIYLLYTNKKEHKELKAGLFILTLFLITPSAGKIFNGFAYPSNRWMFSYIFLLAYIVVVEWKELFAMKKKRFVGLCLIVIALLTYNFCVYSQYFKEKLYGYCSLIFLTLFLIAISAVLTQNEFKKKRYLSNLQIVMVIVIVMTVQLNTKQIFYNFDKEGKKTEYASMRRVKQDLSSVADKAVSKAASSDRNFFRYEAKDVLVERNSTLQSKLNSTNFYWSLSGKLPAQLFSETALINKGAYNYKGLDGRTFLNAIAATKYYVTRIKNDGNYVTPFGYKKVGEYKIKTAKRSKRCAVFKNMYALPLGYTYDSYYTRNTYEKMNEIERQNALLQGVLLEKENLGYTKTNITQNYTEIPYKIAACNGVKRKGNIFEVQKREGQIVLETKQNIKNSELNLFIGNVSIPQRTRVADDDSRRAKYNIFTQNSDGKINLKRMFYFQPGNIYYAERNHFLVNLGYYKEGTQTITITFPSTGKYKINNCRLYAQSMNQYPKEIAKLKENILENIKIRSNSIQGRIKLNRNKFLFLSVPYSKGWTAFVDGKKQEILQANTMYMALSLKKGVHKIQLSYRTPGLESGIILSFGGWMLYVILFIYEKKHTGKHNA